MRNALGQLVGATNFKPVRIGGGGFVTGISTSDDGNSKICTLDVFNSYVKGDTDTEWRPLFTPDTLQASEYDPRPDNGALVDFLGGFGAAVARSDKTKLCAGWNGFFYFSSNTGVGMTRGNLAAKRMFTNTGGQRNWNDKIASHPSNSSTWLLGTTNDGVYYTTNHGSTITACNGTIAAPADYSGVKSSYLVAIGPTGIAYIFVYGTGVYSAASVSGTFTLMSGSPTSASHMVVDQNGTIWICDFSAAGGSSLKKCVSGTWSTQSNQGGRVWNSVAICPSNASKIALTNQDGNLAYTADAFTTIAEFQPSYPTDGTPLIASADITWLAASRTYPSKVMWDGANANRLWQAHGTGIAYSDNPPTTFVPWPWYSQTRGIEELVANNGLSVAGRSGVLFGCWDKPIWKRSASDFDLFTTTPKATTGDTSGIDMAWQFDYAADDAAYRGVSSGYGSDTSGFSNDDGVNWGEYFPSGSQPFTVTIASPAVFTAVGHGFLDGRPVTLTTSINGLPTGLNDYTIYRVKKIDNDTFNLSLTVGGASINTSGSQSGAHTIHRSFPTGEAGGNGGAFAMNQKNHQILIPGANQKAIWTKNGFGGGNKLEPVQGVDWDFLDPSGLGGASAANWINAMYVRRNVFTADKTRPGRFACIMKGSEQGSAAAVQGLWTTGDLATPWTRTVSGRLDSTGDSQDYWNGTLAYIPGKSGELLYTSGPGTSWNSRLLHFTGDGATTSKVVLGSTWTVTNVAKFGFGAKASAAQSYPTIYFVGTSAGVYGLHRTTDFFATQPTLLQRFPNHNLDVIAAVFGDMNLFGRVYVGFGGSAWAYGDYGFRVNAA